MRHVIAFCLMFVVSTGAALAQSAEAQAVLDAAAGECAALENGTFDARDAVSEIEMGSQFGSVSAEIVDEARFACSTAASLFCGSGGCMLNLVVAGDVLAWQATGWRLIDWGPDTVLLIGRDGGWCGGAGAEVCYEALVWSNDRILSVGPAPEMR